ncbi:hypothetical protein HMPREF3034_02288 [Prevotella sp. DNF00663]|nr:hypothetical protein HMPREF3034_02288 [Prevotella sp. DNF00663]
MLLFRLLNNLELRFIYKRVSFKLTLFFCAVISFVLIEDEM